MSSSSEKENQRPAAIIEATDDNLPPMQEVEGKKLNEKAEPEPQALSPDNDSDDDEEIRRSKKAKRMRRVVDESCSDSDEKGPTPSPAQTRENVGKSARKKAKVLSSEDESDAESDEDAGNEKKRKAESPSAKSGSAENDSDDSDEPMKPSSATKKRGSATKGRSKRARVVMDESDSDGDSDLPKSTKKPARRVLDDSDEEVDESEDKEKPSEKPVESDVESGEGCPPEKEVASAPAESPEGEERDISRDCDSEGDEANPDAVDKDPVPKDANSREEDSCSEENSLLGDAEGEKPESKEDPMFSSDDDDDDGEFERAKLRKTKVGRLAEAARKRREKAEAEAAAKKKKQRLEAEEEGGDGLDGLVDEDDSPDEEAAERRAKLSRKLKASKKKSKKEKKSKKSKKEKKRRRKQAASESDEGSAEEHKDSSDKEDDAEEEEEEEVEVGVARRRKIKSKKGRKKNADDVINDMNLDEESSGDDALRVHTVNNASSKPKRNQRKSATDMFKGQKVLAVRKKYTLPDGTVMTEEEFKQMQEKEKALKKKKKKNVNEDGEDDEEIAAVQGSTLVDEDDDDSLSNEKMHAETAALLREKKPVLDREEKEPTKIDKRALLLKIMAKNHSKPVSSSVTARADDTGKHVGLTADTFEGNGDQNDDDDDDLIIIAPKDHAVPILNEPSGNVPKYLQIFENEKRRREKELNNTFLKLDAKDEDDLDEVDDEEELLRDAAADDEDEEEDGDDDDEEENDDDVEEEEEEEEQDDGEEGENADSAIAEKKVESVVTDDEEVKDTAPIEDASALFDAAVELAPKDAPAPDRDGEADAEASLVEAVACAEPGENLEKDASIAPAAMEDNITRAGAEDDEVIPQNAEASSSPKALAPVTLEYKESQDDEPAPVEPTFIRFERRPRSVVRQATFHLPMEDSTLGVEASADDSNDTPKAHTTDAEATEVQHVLVDSDAKMAPDTTAPHEETVVDVEKSVEKEDAVSEVAPETNSVPNNETMLEKAPVPQTADSFEPVDTANIEVPDETPMALEETPCEDGALTAEPANDENTESVAPVTTAPAPARPVTWKPPQPKESITKWMTAQRKQEESSEGVVFSKPAEDGAVDASITKPKEKKKKKKSKKDRKQPQNDDKIDGDAIATSKKKKRLDDVVYDEEDADDEKKRKRRLVNEDSDEGSFSSEESESESESEESEESEPHVVEPEDVFDEEFAGVGPVVKPKMHKSAFIEDEASVSGSEIDPDDDEDGAIEDDKILLAQIAAEGTVKINSRRERKLQNRLEEEKDVKETRELLKNIVNGHWRDEPKAAGDKGLLDVSDGEDDAYYDRQIEDLAKVVEVKKPAPKEAESSESEHEDEAPASAVVNEDEYVSADEDSGDEKAKGMNTKVFLENLEKEQDMDRLVGKVQYVTDRREQSKDYVKLLRQNSNLGATAESNDGPAPAQLARRPSDMNKPLLAGARPLKRFGSFLSRKVGDDKQKQPNALKNENSLQNDSSNHGMSVTKGSDSMTATGFVFKRGESSNPAGGLAAPAPVSEAPVPVTTSTRAFSRFATKSASMGSAPTSKLFSMMTSNVSTVKKKRVPK